MTTQLYLWPFSGPVTVTVHLLVPAYIYFPPYLCQLLYLSLSQSLWISVLQKKLRLRVKELFGAVLGGQKSPEG